MINYLWAYLASLVSMAVIDAAWLGLIASGLYKKHLGFILADKPNWLAAVAFYLIFVMGITVFIVYPGWKNSDGLMKIGLLGALFGLVTYATYDLTNLATLKNWPLSITLIDLMWGTFLGAIVCMISVSALKYFLR